MPIFSLPGASAFTPATLAKRLAKIQAANPQVSALAAEFVHFVEIDSPLPDAEQLVLTARAALRSARRSQSRGEPAGAAPVGGSAHRYHLALVLQGH